MTKNKIKKKKPFKKITQTKEDYLRVIYLFEEKTNHPIRAVELAHDMGLAKSTISERLRELAAQGLIKASYSVVTLTPSGRVLARDLTFKHRIIEVFLHDVLKMPLEKIHDEAHRLEHAFSDYAIRRLAKLVGNPEKDPHGEEIPLRWRIVGGK